MTPSAFTFTLTVPRDLLVVEIVRDVAAHAVTYAQIGPAIGQDFVDRVAEASALRLAAGGPSGCVVTFTGDEDGLHVSFDGVTIHSA